VHHLAGDFSWLPRKGTKVALTRFAAVTVRISTTEQEIQT